MDVLQFPAISSELVDSLLRLPALWAGNFLLPGAAPFPILVTAPGQRRILSTGGRLHWVLNV